MKILKLKFLNLNSLTGTWNIDFTHPAFTSSGIFVITGPTGSGKTTVLDAICLALYGKTPRLGKITKSGNHIMSRHTGECSAEVIFESQKGLFTCHWSQRKARNKPQGELQSPQHEISRTDTGEILGTKLSQVQEIVEDVTGMTYDQFTRSILLAQGGFAAFLQAGADDRAPILEQITGTEIYTNLSIRTHERYTKEQASLEQIETELNVIQILSPEEKTLLEDQITELQNDGIRVDLDIAKTSGAIHWLDTIKQLQAEILNLEAERESLERRKTAFEPDLVILHAARKAATCEGTYKVIQEKKENFKQDLQKIHEIEVEYQSHEKNRDLYETAVLTAIQGKEFAEKNQQEGQYIIKTVREVDLRIDECKKRVTTYEDQQKSLQILHDECCRKRDICKKKQQEIQDIKDKAALYIGEHPHDEVLLENYSGIENKIFNLREMYTSLKKLVTSHGEQTKLLERMSQELKNLLIEKEKQKEIVEKNSIRLVQHEQNLQDILGETTLLKQRTIYENLRNRVEQLTRLHEVISETASLQERISSLEKNGEDLTHYLQVSGYEKEHLTAIIASHERELETKRKCAILAAKIRDLTKERTLLKDGSPCPLCGSQSHPYTHGIPASPDEALDEVTKEEMRGKELNRKLSELNETIVKKEVELKNSHSLHDEFRGKLDQYNKTYKEKSLELGLDMDVSGRSQVLSPILDTENSRLLSLHETICAAEICEGKIKSETGLLSEERESLRILDDRYRDKQYEFQTLNETIKNSESDISSHKETITSLETEVNQDLDGLAAGVNRETNLNALLLTLKNRRTRYKDEKIRIETCEKEIMGCESDIQKISGSISEKESEIIRKSEIIKKEKATLETLVSERTSIFGEKNPDTEEKKLEDQVRTARLELDTRIEEKSKLITQIQSSKELLKDLNLRIEKSRTEILILESDFQNQILKAGFTDEASFTQALRTQEKIVTLEKNWEALKSEKTRIDTRIESTRTRYTEESSKDLTCLSYEELLENLEQFQKNKTEIFSEIGKNQEKLSRHEEMIRLQGTKIKECRERKREVDKWSRLHELIGSADGKKFRVFAQGLTFCILLQHANQHLQKMTDRYILVQDPELPLDMQVIDSWQGGVIRTVKNLSGGEVFMVSLALALGLSGMASRNVRVDSLFLDEGFGTLDEETLETALETLSGLQQDGKLIGVISHVTALKERIPARILIEKGSNGRSTMVIPE